MSRLALMNETDLSRPALWTLEIPARVDGIAQLAAWLATVFPPEAQKDSTYQNARLCLEEALTNIVTHAALPEQKGDITVCHYIEDEVLVFEVIDSGPEFDPSQIEDPERPDDITKLVPGGLGIGLMRQFSDRMHYRRQNGRNHLVFGFNRDPAMHSP